MSKLDEALFFYDQFYVSEQAVHNGKNLTKDRIKTLIRDLIDQTFDKDDAKALEFWRKVEAL